MNVAFRRAVPSDFPEVRRITREATCEPGTSRLRSLLGDAVASNPCRLVAGLAGFSDTGRALRLLSEGRMAEVLDAYRAPLLSRSSTMAVQLLREWLDLALGAAVCRRGDAELISRLLSTAMGSADALAVEALGRC